MKMVAPSSEICTYILADEATKAMYNEDYRPIGLESSVLAELPGRVALYRGLTAS